MSWNVNENNTITVITTQNVNLSAYKTMSSDSVYSALPGTFIKNGDRYYLNVVITEVGKYIIRVVDLNNKINEQYIDVEVKDLNNELFNSLDSYPNKNDWKGLSAIQDVKLTEILNNTETLGTDLINVKSTVDSLPTLLDIENSTILAKKSDISVVEAIVNSIPVLSDIRNELINVTFGALEIANNQLTIKDKSGTVIAIFDLFDKNGNPTMLSVFRREVIL